MITAEIRKGAVLAERYRVVRRLGAGGMATVFLAEDERLGRDVAIKRLNTNAPEESLRRFMREARLGAALNHPNLVSVFDTLATDEGALIVMEYVPGRSLEDLAKRGPVDGADAIPILRGTAAALDHAHQQGVVHRDIKPSNVLVRDDGTVKVADLGIARAVDASQITSEGKVIGTLPYIAPERRQGIRAGGPESDIYALAAVAYELLSGRPLDTGFGDTGPASGPPDLVRESSGLPPTVTAAIERGLDEDPRRRQRSAGELVDDLEAALAAGGDEPTSPIPTARAGAGPTPARTLAADGSRRRSGLATKLALTLLGLALLTAAGIALVGGDSGEEPAQVPEKDRGAAESPESRGSADTSASEGGSAESGSAGTSAAEPAISAAGSGDGASLNAQGFELINQGRAEEAVPILQRAVASFPAGTSDLDYAYALFNLGNALRLSGRPDDAIPILEQRLRIPNQRATVAAELARARTEAASE